VKLGVCREKAMKVEGLFAPHRDRLSEDVRGTEVTGLCRDTRSLKKGDIFFIIEGETFDIFSCLKNLPQQPLLFVVDERNRNKVDFLPRKRLLFVESIEQEFRRAVDLYFPLPSHLRFIGVTGTNGKTTVASLLYQILKRCGLRASLVGTIQHRIGNECISAEHTTPEYLTLRKLIHKMHTNSDYVLMEVSSHSIAQKRIEGLAFSHCIFTNLSRDHLDYHKSLESYYQVKKQLFLDHPEAIAFINTDGTYGKVLFESLHSEKYSYGLIEGSTLWAKDIQCRKEAVAFNCISDQGIIPVQTHLLGRHNIANLIASLGVSLSLGIDREFLASIIGDLRAPEGRLEEISKGIFIDYAHTPEALEVALAALREAGFKRSICVFGCGGDRDRGKRKLMGNVASQADFTVITSDNPRSEDPYEIMGEIKKGFSKATYSMIADREKAIEEGVKLKGQDDACALLIAGKGHEAYQIVKGRKIPFKDSDVARRILKETIRV